MIAAIQIYRFFSGRIDPTHSAASISSGTDLSYDQDTLINWLSQEVEEHKSILDAIASHNPDLAERISSNHTKAFMKDDLIEIINVPHETLDDGKRQMGL